MLRLHSRALLRWLSAVGPGFEILIRISIAITTIAINFGIDVDEGALKKD